MSKLSQDPQMRYLNARLQPLKKLNKPILWFSLGTVGFITFCFWQYKHNPQWTEILGKSMDSKNAPSLLTENSQLSDEELSKMADVDTSTSLVYDSLGNVDLTADPDTIRSQLGMINNPKTNLSTSPLTDNTTANSWFQKVGNDSSTQPKTNPYDIDLDSINKAYLINSTRDVQTLQNPLRNALSAINPFQGKGEQETAPSTNSVNPILLINSNNLVNADNVNPSANSNYTPNPNPIYNPAVVAPIPLSPTALNGQPLTVTPATVTPLGQIPPQPQVQPSPYIITPNSNTYNPRLQTSPYNTTPIMSPSPLVQSNNPNLTSKFNRPLPQR